MIFFLLIADHQLRTEVKVVKKVSFEQKSNHVGTSTESSNVMDTQKDEGIKPSFLMGGEDIEDMDSFPIGNSSNIGLAKQLSEAALIDKRRRLR